MVLLSIWYILLLCCTATLEDVYSTYIHLKLWRCVVVLISPQAAVHQPRGYVHLSRPGSGHLSPPRHPKLVAQITLMLVTADARDNSVMSYHSI